MKQTMRVVLILAGALLLQGGCVDDQKKTDQVVTNTEAPPSSKRMGRVAKNWQVKFQKTMQDQPGSAAFILVSESTYADIGQFLIIESGSEAKLFRVAPASKNLEPAKTLTPEQWKSIAPHLEKASGLSDVEVKQFDGTRYEFVEFSRATAGTGWQESHRVLIATPNFDQGTKQHYDLIQAFKALHP